MIEHRIHLILLAIVVAAAFMTLAWIGHPEPALPGPPTNTTIDFP